MIRFSLTILSSLFAFAPATVVADQVWIAPARKTKADSTWYPKPMRTYEGEIVEFDSKQLRLLIKGDEAPTLIASHRVVWIDAGKLPDKESTAMKLVADGDYGQSLRPLIDAVSARPPVWRQQWLSMMAAQSAWRANQGKLALELVSQLDARPLPPLTLSWLPVAWDSSVRDARGKPLGSADAARERLGDSSAAVKLVAASWLLSTPSRREAAGVLKQLSTDTQRPVIARLAETLTWHTATPPEVVENADVWERKVAALPIVLQTGPTKTIVEKFQRAGLNDRAKKLKLMLELTPAAPNLK